MQNSWLLHGRYIYGCYMVGIYIYICVYIAQHFAILLIVIPVCPYSHRNVMKRWHLRPQFRHKDIPTLRVSEEPTRDHQRTGSLKQNQMLKTNLRMNIFHSKFPLRWLHHQWMPSMKQEENMKKKNIKPSVCSSNDSYDYVDLPTDDCGYLVPSKLNSVKESISEDELSYVLPNTLDESSSMIRSLREEQDPQRHDRIIEEHSHGYVHVPREAIKERQSQSVHVEDLPEDYIDLSSPKEVKPLEDDHGYVVHGAIKMAHSVQIHQEIPYQRTTYICQAIIYHFQRSKNCRTW